MKLTALIRTHPGREELTKRAIKSCKQQGVDYIIHQGEKVNDYSYNLYCNELKAKVNEGYFFFLDSDDVIVSGAIPIIKSSLEPNRANICQMLRSGKPKPSRKEYIREGFIGMPCLILHYSHKFLSDVTATENGDWIWIKGVIEKLPINFISFPMVDAGRRSHGK